jgi:citrate synthase
MQTALARSTEATIEVCGLDLCDEIMGHVPLSGVAFLELSGRLPTESELRLIDAMLVSLVEHGLTPSALAARLTYHGAPESLQAAVAAGLSGLGSVFVGTIEGSARLVQEALRDDDGTADLAQLADELVARSRAERRFIPGVGHPLHKSGDPRAARLFAIARDAGLYGRHAELMELVGAAAAVHYGRKLPVNVTGAIGSLASELGFPWQVCRGLGVMSRAIGLVGHLAEELRTPLAGEIVDYAAPVRPTAV